MPYVASANICCLIFVFPFPSDYTVNAMETSHLVADMTVRFLSCCVKTPQALFVLLTSMDRRTSRKQVEFGMFYARLDFYV